MSGALVYVESLSTPGRRYALRRFPSGEVVCECVRFSYQRTCKHVAIWEAAQHAVKRCADAGHIGELNNGDGYSMQGVCAQCLVDVLVAAAMKVRRGYEPKAKVEEIKDKAQRKVVDLRERLKRRNR